MASKFGLSAYQAKRQALINLALKREPAPVTPRSKTVVTFVEDVPSNNTSMQEFPSTSTPIHPHPSSRRQIITIGSAPVILGSLPITTAPVNELPLCPRHASAMAPVTSPPLKAINELPPANTQSAYTVTSIL